jgi:ABC-type branched-subunit amino acid transport system ATPase component
VATPPGMARAGHPMNPASAEEFGLDADPSSDQSADNCTEVMLRAVRRHRARDTTPAMTESPGPSPAVPPLAARPPADARPPTAGALLELRGVGKRFGGVVAHADISLSVAEGAIAGLIGPNGSGKTTLFDVVTGLYPPDAGDVLLDGRSVAGLDPGQIARRGVVRTFQQASVYPGMTCRQCLLVSISHARAGWGTLFSRPGRSQHARALELLAFVGLHDQSERMAGELSYGQQKLLELAMALMSQPRVLLLDEPTAGVSPALIGPLVDHLRRINTQLGVTLVIIEHNMGVVMGLAHEVHCLVRGRLLVSGPPARIRADSRVLDAYLGV